MFDLATVPARPAPVCPEHFTVSEKGEPVQTVLRPIPTDPEWLRCTHIGKRGGRCLYTRRVQ